MKYVVAVSGGVDSVVLLDMLASEGGHELTVAHFDHGIREDSAADARFVAGLAKKYALPFETRREELGKNASEELARDRRYAFLRDVATARSARLVTAHHLDDLVETVAINLHRGTGWRGLAVLGSPDVERPLLHMTKHEVYEYALAHALEWVEDETNVTDDYLRNRLRRRLRLSVTSKRLIADLRDTQVELRSEIDIEASRFLTEKVARNRYFFTMLDEPAALELLRAIVLQENRSLTRPQLGRLWLAIKTARPGTVLEAGGDIRVRFTAGEFIVNHY